MVEIVVHPNGTVQCLYTDAIDLTALGTLEIVRATSIEWSNEKQLWVTKILATGEEFTHHSRAEALAFEVELLEKRLVGGEI